jgi:hypothetical protein
MRPLATLDRLKQWKGERVDDRLMQPAAGVEAELGLFVDDKPARPEHVFGDPRGFLSIPLLHRTGRSFHLPNGCAIYFDTGVIEIASPVMRLERGCFGRLARSIASSIACVRRELDGWERRTGRPVRLQGFSTHYNVSVADVDGDTDPSSRLRALAWLLVHVLPAPVMLLGTNRRSTGVGVRPRPRRIEVTADYPPDPVRLAATGSVIAGIVSTVGGWEDLSLDVLSRRRIPVIEGFQPIRHTSRRGWLARAECYPANPFVCVADRTSWPTTRGAMTLRELAAAICRVFRSRIRAIADPMSYAAAQRILTGKTKSWLEDDDRPAAYDDVGRGSVVPQAFVDLGIDPYERVVRNAIERRPLVLAADEWIPIAVRGWSRVVFRRTRDSATTILPLDTLVGELGRW